MRLEDDLTAEEQEAARKAGYFGSRGWGINLNGQQLLCPEGEVAKLAGVVFEKDALSYLWPLKAWRIEVSGWRTAGKCRDRVMEWLGCGFSVKQKRDFRQVSRPQYALYDKRLVSERRGIFSRATY